MASQNSSSILVWISFAGTLMLVVTLSLLTETGSTPARSGPGVKDSKTLHFEFLAREFYDR